MLLLGDRAFFSDGRGRDLEARGVKWLARVVPSLVPRPIRALADGSDLAQVDKSPSDRSKDRYGIMVRMIRYPRDDPQRADHAVVPVRIGNLFDPALSPADEWIILDHERWRNWFDEPKTHQDPRCVPWPAPSGARRPVA